MLIFAYLTGHYPLIVYGYYFTSMLQILLHGSAKYSVLRKWVSCAKNASHLIALVMPLYWAFLVNAKVMLNLTVYRLPYSSAVCTVQ